MGKGTYTRRALFQGITKGNNKSNEKDALFEKFSRKQNGARIYDETLVDYDQIKQRGAENGSAERIGNITSGLAPYTGTWGTRQVLHLLRRTSFGWKKNYVDQLSAMTMSAAVDLITTFNTATTTNPVVYYNGIFPDENSLPMGADWTNDFFATSTNGFGTTSNDYRIASLRRWLFSHLVNSDNHMREKMMLFLFHFVPIDFTDVRNSSFPWASVNGARIMYNYMKMLRDYSNGNFKDFIKTMSKEPAMMYYLNNQANTKTAPDENFARELMELFTLGKDPASQYTQNDVVEAAKVLTGWRVTGMNTATVASTFNPTLHHTGNKQFSAFFNNNIISYQSGPAGANEFDQLIDMIFSKDTVLAQYICRRIYRFFVYYDIDANIEANVIAPLAQVFISNNWNIMPVINTLLKSEHFYDVANYGVYIKSPLDVVAGMLNMFNVDINAGANLEGQYYLWGYYNDTKSSSMEQRLGSIPNVAGWNAFYQPPAFHQYWINSVTIQNRERFINELFNGVTLTISPGNTKKIQVDVIAFAQLFGNAIAQDPDALVDTCIQYLLPIDLSATVKQDLKATTLLSGQTSNGYWTTAWNNYINNPTNTSYKTIVETRLKNLLVSITKLAEFQLM